MELSTLLERMKLEHLETQLEAICDDAAVIISVNWLSRTFDGGW